MLSGKILNLEFVGYSILSMQDLIAYFSFIQEESLSPFLSLQPLSLSLSKLEKCTMNLYFSLEDCKAMPPPCTSY